MTLQVLEIGDIGIRVSDQNEVKLLSTGIAYIAQGQSVFGAQAQHCLRIDPLNCQHQFWDRLSVEPFAKPLVGYRHQADLAFAHLQAIAKQGLIEGDVLLAVSSHFTRAQLAVLLGLSKHCPFNIVGMVDSALLAATTVASKKAVIYLDLQLHQIVVTKIRQEGSELAYVEHAQLPATGWMQISETLLQFLNSVFIQQSRFNPQHDANTEQYLFDTLPQWLQNINASEDGRNTEGDTAHGQSINLMHKKKLYQVQIPHSSFVAKMAKVYESLNEQIAQFSDDQECVLVLSSSMQMLPRIRQALQIHGAQVMDLDEHALAQAMYAQSDQIRSKPDAIHLMTSLLVPDKQISIEDKVQRIEPTHLLAEYRAQSIDEHMAIFIQDKRLCVAAYTKLHNELILGQILRQNGQILLSPVGQGLMLNDRELTQRECLNVGDKIGAHSLSAQLTLIRVSDD